MAKLDKLQLLEGLNEPQREAVTWPGGPLLVLAGAGSGKTRVLTHRVAWLIASGMNPASVLAMTFTNKAAREMADRVQQLLGRTAEGMWMGTFHAICVRILRAHAEKVGYDSHFGIADGDDQAQLVHKIIREMGLDRTHKPAAVLAEIGRAKEQMVSPPEYLGRASGFWEEKAGEIYRSYAQRLREADLMDFDDLLVLTVRLFREHDQVRESYARRFVHILVDEFQDTNRVQYQLLRLLASHHGNLTVVGDDDQSIYGWRGADIRNILDFERDFPGAKTIRLEQNYRSTQVILDASHGVISHNRGRKGKRLWTEKEGGHPVLLYRAESEEDEARFIVQETARLAEERGCSLSDVAVLYRTHAQSRVLEETFVRHGIPYVVVGSVHFYQRKEIKDVLAYLRVTLNPRDDVSLERIINVPRRGIGEETLRKLREYASRRRLSLREALSHLAATPAQPAQPPAQPAAVPAQPSVVGLSRGMAARLEDFARLLDDIEQRLSLPAHEVITYVLERTGYLSELQAEGTPDAQSRMENLKELVVGAVDFARRSPDGTPAAFLAEVALLTSADVPSRSPLPTGGASSSPNGSVPAHGAASAPDGSVPRDGLSAGAVTLMTLHAAKGLEFPVVFLAGLEEGVFPHARSLENEAQLEEERRLCYVGMTRAKERLYLSCSAYRSFYGDSQRIRPSRFLEEIPRDLLQELGRVDHFDHAVVATAGRTGHAGRADRADRADGGGRAGRGGQGATAGRLWTGTQPLPPGTRVRHAKFGQGVVISCRGQGEDAEVTVAFPENGVRTLVARYANLDAAP